jgi:hypothetical protein
MASVERFFFGLLALLLLFLRLSINTGVTCQEGGYTHFTLYGV